MWRVRSRRDPLLRALKVAAEAQERCGIDGTGCLREVRYLSIGNGCLCRVPDEIMGELALESSKLMGDDLFCLGGYTDGCTGHLPTAEKFDEGGYEEYWSMLVYYVYHGRAFPLRRDSAGRLVRFVGAGYPIVKSSFLKLPYARPWSATKCSTQ